MARTYKYTDLTKGKHVQVIKDDHYKLDKIIQEVRIFKRSYVKVGVLEGTQRKARKQSRRIMMAMIAAVHEYGSPKRHIPERSYIRSWVDQNKGDIHRILHKLLGNVEDGKIDATTALKKLGAFGVAGIRKQIRSVKSPPLKPATIERKGSTQPLIDTGQLRNSIHYQVEKLGLRS
jgi:hypothetical protein